MVKETKFYEILGVSPDCAESQLKSAYKKGALKYHPDKNAHNPDAAEKFKELSHAYEILSDSEKRKIYDIHGEEGLEQGGMSSGGMAAEDLFAQFFGGGGPGGFGGMFGGGSRDTGPRKVRTTSHLHMVSLEDIYRGKTSKLALQKSVICPKCNGKGGKDNGVKTCQGCDGRGFKTIMRQIGPMIQRFQTTCSDCLGAGEFIKDRDKCKTCSGKKTVVERKILHLHIDRGIKSGTKLEFRGEGDQAPGVEPGDVIFEISQKPHPRFKRQGDDLAYQADIDLLSALAGGKFNIEHLDNRWLCVEILPGEVISPGMIKTIRGQGMPSYRHHDYGNLYIHFNVKFPLRITGPNGTGLTPEQSEMLEHVLPPRNPGIQIPADATIEDFTLEDVDPHETNRSMGQANSATEDDEDVPPGAERVQCASQ